MRAMSMVCVQVVGERESASVRVCERGLLFHPSSLLLKSLACSHFRLPTIHVVWSSAARACPAPSSISMLCAQWGTLCVVWPKRSEPSRADLRRAITRLCSSVPAPHGELSCVL